MELNLPWTMPLMPHVGPTRNNDGDWSIVDANGDGVCFVRFRGKAKPGQRWNAPDPEGKAIAEAIVNAVNALSRATA